jgi:hypothetical protein
LFRCAINWKLTRHSFKRCAKVGVLFYWHRRQPSPSLFSNHRCRFTGVGGQSALPTIMKRKSASVRRVLTSVSLVFETSFLFNLIKLVPWHGFQSVSQLYLVEGSFE